MAQDLLRTQYATVGAAARMGTAAARAAIEAAAARGLELDEMQTSLEERARSAGLYDAAWRRYCWPVESLDDLRLAPFHLLASEGAVHANKDHFWHMDTLGEFCRADEGLLFTTAHRVVELADETAVADAVAWWEELTGRGGEGMVVKPLSFIARGRRGLIQPAIKCRGPEYLRIIYGPEYTLPANLERLRQRGLGRKRSLALREFALGIEALERFIADEPLRRVHECVFAVLALESKPVVPRL